MIIGALVAGGIGLALFINLWWIAIPLLFTCFGGGFGFIFGVGLDVVIAFIILIVMSSSNSEGSSSTNKAVVVQNKPKPTLLPNLEDKASSWTRPIETDTAGEKFRVCTGCLERNNPEFKKCWKCGASL